LYVFAGPIESIHCSLTTCGVDVGQDLAKARMYLEEEVVCNLEPNDVQDTEVIRGGEAVTKEFREADEGILSGPSIGDLVEEREIRDRKGVSGVGQVRVPSDEADELEAKGRWNRDRGNVGDVFLWERREVRRRGRGRGRADGGVHGGGRGGERKAGEWARQHRIEEKAAVSIENSDKRTYQLFRS
jgi:hypothetical protein